MALNTKLIKRRIKSVGSTKKITKAMEMISAVKMRKATENVLKTRSYATLAWKMLKDVSVKSEVSVHPLLRKEKNIKKVAVVLITSNRGLCGGFVTKLLQETNKYIQNLKKENPELEANVILMGKKGRKIYKYYKHQIVQEYEKLDLTTKIEDILPLAKVITAEFIEKKYDKIALAYTDFESAVNQTPKILELLPLGEEDEGLGKTIIENKNNLSNNKEKNDINEFTFEPNPKEVLNILLPKLVEMQVYQAILESDASEHSSRMLAMRNATDAAKDMIDDLTMTFNKARQSKITQEISEIVGGAAALE